MEYVKIVLSAPESHKKPNQRLNFSFTAGRNYSFRIEKGKTQSAEENFVFSYEGKQGIHHMFREIFGKWTRTYTDAQLIRKRVKEVML